jgi:hypothetical protein
LGNQNENKTTKNTKTKIKYVTLCFLRELRVLRGETSFFIKCKEFIIIND